MDDGHDRVGLVEKMSAALEKKVPGANLSFSVGSGPARLGWTGRTATHKLCS